MKGIKIIDTTITVGQKLYHFAYGQLTVVAIKEAGKYVETTADNLKGCRQKDFYFTTKQTWLTETIGHWLFESPNGIGSENNDFDWKKIWPSYSHEPVEPLKTASNQENWHEMFLEEKENEV